MLSTTGLVIRIMPPPPLSGIQHGESPGTPHEHEAPYETPYETPYENPHQAHDPARQRRQTELAPVWDSVRDSERTERLRTEPCI